MGYCVAVICNEVVLRSADVPRAMEVLRGLALKQHRYSWVESGCVLNCIDNDDIIGAFSEWRYDARALETEDPITALAVTPQKVFPSIVIEAFTGDKLGDDEMLWRVLAPFVVSGATIEFRGEDGAMWRYLFTDDALVEQTARIVWE